MAVSAQVAQARLVNSAAIDHAAARRRPTPSRPGISAKTPWSASTIRAAGNRNAPALIARLQDSASGTETTTAANGSIVDLRRQDGLDFGTWDKRPRVKVLQGLLNAATTATLDVDGMWGPKTSEALHLFQQSQQLAPTESIDGTTANALRFGGAGSTAGAEQSPDHQQLAPEQDAQGFGNGIISMTAGKTAGAISDAAPQPVSEPFSPVEALASMVVPNVFDTPTVTPVRELWAGVVRKHKNIFGGMAMKIRSLKQTLLDTIGNVVREGVRKLAMGIATLFGGPLVGAVFSFVSTAWSILGDWFQGLRDLDPFQWMADRSPA